MTERSTSHATFVIERTYPAAPARVYAAWTSRDAKVAWFGGGPENWQRYDLDFQIGGWERGLSKAPDGALYSYDARYEEIVPDERITYAYTMDRDDTRISVSVTSVELRAEGQGTKLTYTEMGVYLDGHDKPQFREEGTASLLDALGKLLA
jgi:uncharacterized protein YndB with AHSA1/START domain